MVILTILILPIHDHGISFHLFVSSLISFISVLSIGFFTSLVKFTTRYFSILDVIATEVVFLISLSNSSLLEMQQISVYLSCILQTY